MSTSLGLKYRSDIDGLRALAIIAVVGFHIFPNIFSGGFVGVDVFFVISGYLISGIIFKQGKNFSFKEFYIKRIKRIFPALVCVLVACLVFGWFALMPEDYKQLGKHVVGGVLFSSNFILWNEVGYFDPAIEYKPLMHLWSLGIEEQFYIVWPFLLYFVRKYKANLLFIIMFLIFTSFTISITGMHTTVTGNFYSPLIRFWELLIGALLAFLSFDKDFPKFNKLSFLTSRLSKSFFSLVGIVLIAYAIFFLDPTKPFPGWRALLPTLGAFLLIASGSETFIHRRILSSKIMIGVGLISFPLYLWHWPILSFARIFKWDVTLPKISISIIVLSSVLAWLTYQFIEKPIRFNQSKATLKILFLNIIMIVIGGFGFYIFKDNGIHTRLPKIMQEILNKNYLDWPAQWREKQCFLDPTQDNTKFADSCVDTKEAPLVFIWGDSHAAALYPGFKFLQKTLNFSIAQRTASACPSLFSYTREDRPYCKDINNSNMALIKELKPQIVVLHSFWSAYDLKDLHVVVNEIKKSGVNQILLIGPVPQWDEDLPKILYENYKENPFNPLPATRIKSKAFDWNKALDNQMKGEAERLEIQYFSLFNLLCNQDGCLTWVETINNLKSIIQWDVSHFTPAGSILVAKSIGPLLKL